MPADNYWNETVILKYSRHKKKKYIYIKLDVRFRILKYYISISTQIQKSHSSVS